MVKTIINEISQKFLTLRKTIKDYGPLLGFLAMVQYFSPIPINGVFYVIMYEMQNLKYVKLPLNQRLKAFKLGLPSKLYIVYNIEKSNDPTLFFSEFSAEISNRKLHINKNILGDKINFYNYMKKNKLDRYLPKLYGIIEHGEFKGKKNIISILKNEIKIVLKPHDGSGGEGIYFCEMKNGFILINGKKNKIKFFSEFIKNLHNYLVIKYCKQSTFLNDIFPNSANTIRILEMYPKNKSPFIADACLRIGTEKSGFVDNLRQGGLTAKIDLETGILSSAAEIKKSGEIIWYEYHPDTNSKIKNIAIPEWNNFKKEFLSFNKKISEFRLVAWDILLTGKGKFVIIEGNNGLPDYKIHQVHGPLLKNQRVKKFFLDNKITV